MAETARGRVCVWVSSWMGVSCTVHPVADLCSGGRTISALASFLLIDPVPWNVIDLAPSPRTRVEPAEATAAWMGLVGRADSVVALFAMAGADSLHLCRFSK